MSVKVKMDLEYLDESLLRSGSSYIVRFLYRVRFRVSFLSHVTPLTSIRNELLQRKRNTREFGINVEGGDV